MLTFAVFVFGALVGSFLNVCIPRFPRARSSFPASQCPKCQSRSPYDNIPILSYLLLRGRCRNCRARISALYPAVEMLTGAPRSRSLRLGSRRTPSPSRFAGAGGDHVHRPRPPDHPRRDQPARHRRRARLLAGVAAPTSTRSCGVAVGGGILLAVAWLYQRLRGREGMGGGDIKLLAMIGAFLGWQSIFVTLFVGSVIGPLIGVGVMMLRGRHQARHPVRPVPRRRRRLRPVLGRPDHRGGT